MISDNGASAGHVVRIVIPAHNRFLRVARLTAAGIAGDLGFGLQDLDDVRVAVDELCAVIIHDVDPNAEIELRYVIGEDHLEISGRCTHPGPEPELDVVAAELLRMTTDEYQVDADGSGRSFRMVRRRREPVG